MGEQMTVNMQQKQIPVAGLLLTAIIAALLTTAHRSSDRSHELLSTLERSQNLNAYVPDSQPIDSLPVQGFVVDHHSIALFAEIPESYLTAARNLPMLFSDRSVGQNMNEALDCLTAANWESSPAYCRRDYYDADWNWETYKAADYSKGLVPTRILFDPDPVKYDRSKWTFEYKDGSWSELTQDFIQVLAPAYLDSKSVLSYQFGYLHVEKSSDIADPDTGFFADNEDKDDVYDLEAFIAQHPDKVFIFWTISPARSIGTQAATDFNNQMRQYALEHDKILFDMADIVAHTDQGDACYDNRDGIEYCTKNGKCENHPDDGQDLPAICQDYTTEIDGGHLGSVSGAKIRMAKAFWVLMAGIAGWDGVGTSPAEAFTNSDPNAYSNSTDESEWMTR
jgi:hypothetical protein